MSTNLSPDFRLPEGRVIFMSYGLLNRLSMIIGEPDNLPAIYLDPGLQGTVISHLLGSYDAEKKQFIPQELDELQISPIVIADMLAWVSEHILDFFVLTLENAKGLESKYKHLQATATASPSTTDGSKA